MADADPECGGSDGDGGRPGAGRLHGVGRRTDAHHRGSEESLAAGRGRPQGAAGDRGRDVQPDRPPDCREGADRQPGGRPQAQIDCLTAAGYPATLSNDGQGAYNLAAYTCLAQYPTDPAQSWSRITDDQKRIAYHYLSVTLVQCLTDHGFIPGAVPTEETFLATWDTAVWSPSTDAQPTEEPLVDGRLPRETQEAVEKACPMNTPSALIWGE